MYERMLDKQTVPSFDDLIRYSADCGELWPALDKHLQEEYSAQKLIRFPYGNSYGWGVKYSFKKKHICDVFEEDNAFMVFFRISNNDFEPIENELTDYSKDIWENKYPCGEGGWLWYRVLSEDHLQDVKKIIQAKIS